MNSVVIMKDFKKGNFVDVNSWHCYSIETALLFSKRKDAP